MLILELFGVGRCSTPLRRLSESSILIGSAMFGATFKLVTLVGIP